MAEDGQAPSPADHMTGMNERLRDLEELQQEVAKRIRDNERFLQRFMDEDFEEEEESGEGEAEVFEEL